METKSRSLVKAIIWQVMGLTMMAVVGVIATGSFRVGGTIALMNALIGFVSYLLYERVWARISWGRFA